MDYQKLLQRLIEVIEAETASVKRDLSISQVWSQVYGLIQNASEDWVWIDDLYRGTDGNLYAIVVRDGRLWQYPIQVNNDEITVGEAIEVIVHFSDVSRGTQLSIRRDALTGKRRWTAIASAAVLNRVGEIDSRDLFDSFERAVDDGEDDPYFTVYHQGLSLRIGTVDFLKRDGDLYINSGLLDEEGENADLARAVGDLLETEASDEWGISIGFYATKSPQLLRINDTIEIPVYTEGIHVESSLLLERDAASILTNVIVREGNLMPNKARSAALEAALKKLYPNDDAAVQDVLDRADERQRAITDNHMITREQPAPEGEQPEGAQEIALEIDDALVADLVEQTRAALDAEYAPRFQTLETKLAATEQALQTEQQAREQERTAYEQRFAALGKPIDQKVREQTADAPRRKVVTVSRAPGREVPDPDEDEEKEFSLADVAANTARHVNGH